MSEPGTITTFPPRQSAWWGAATRFLFRNRTQAMVLGGSVVMLIGSVLVSILNFAYNVAVARLLGPAGFGHAAVAITLLMFVSAVTLSFQLVGAKLVARSGSDAEKAAVYQRLMKRAWKIGAAVGIGLSAFSVPIAAYLNLPTAWMIVLLAAGFAFYIPVGARRGGMQGMCAFKRFAASYVIEALLKFVAAVVLVEAGFGAMGAIAAISASLVLAYFFPRVPKQLHMSASFTSPASAREAMQAIVFFVGQVLISNSDILLVKHFFPADTAGLYAAIALVGRVVYFASWMVISAMFPISAGAGAEEEGRHVLAVPLLFVLGVTGGFIALLSLFPEFVLHTVFGQMFAAGATLDSLLALYAAAAGIYSLSVVLIAYEMSRKIANTGWWQLAFSGLIVGGIYVFHHSLQEVVVVQLVIMGALLLVVALPFVRRIPTVRQQEAA